MLKSRHGIVEEMVVVCLHIPGNSTYLANIRRGVGVLLHQYQDKHPANQEDAGAETGTSWSACAMLQPSGSGREQTAAEQRRHEMRGTYTEREHPRTSL